MSKFGGPERDRTDDIQLAKLALYQLSYGPTAALEQAAHLFSQRSREWQYIKLERSRNHSEFHVRIIQMLTRHNYQKGFLIDDEWMAGVSEEPAAAPGQARFTAFILSHATGEYMDYRPFDDLQSAIDRINSIPRFWKFENTSQCGGCGDGTCDQGNCQKKNGSCETVCKTSNAS
jgi:hypothetical protein